MNVEEFVGVGRYPLFHFISRIIGEGVRTMANKVEQVVEDIVQELLSDEYELVDVEYVKEGSVRYLRIYIDKDGKMSLQDCEQLSRKISDKLDEIDPIVENYMLEVSSPGLDRVLKKERDFVRECGKEVEVKLYSPLNGRKEWEGQLSGLTSSDEVKLIVGKQEMCIPRKDIAMIRLAVKF